MLAMLAAMGFWCHGAPSAVALVSLDQPWTFQLTAGADPGAGWQQPDFDDSAWARGTPGFGSRPEGTLEITPWPLPSALWTTAYFRAGFNLPDPAGVVWLVLRADYDDGLVVYVNGLEAARRGFSPGQVIGPQTWASPGGRVWGELILLHCPEGTLRPGTNVVAVELHRSGPTDTQAAFVGELLANFSRGPVVQNVSSNRMTITWETPGPADTRLYFGIDGPPAAVIHQSGLVTNHAVALDALPTGCTVRYVAGGAAGTRLFSSPEKIVRLLRPSGLARFSVVGDTGTGTLPQRMVAERLRDPGDFLLHLGDVLYPQFEARYADLRHFSVYRDLLAECPMFLALGNHDLYAGDSAVLASLVLPTNPVTGTEHFYSFDHGEMHIAVLFLPFRYQFSWYPAYALAEGSPQLSWLREDLAATSKPWKVVAAHSPLATSGPHRSDGFPGPYDHEVWQQLLLPILSAHGVQLFLGAHDHGYERLGPFEGVHVVVSGGGGATLYPLYYRDAASAQFWSRYHTLEVEADDEQLRVRALGLDGKPFDDLGLRRHPPLGEVRAVAWHTPRSTAGLAPDGDGNLQGQELDLPEPTWAGLQGRWIHPGEFRMAADRHDLHFGFRNVMMRDGYSLVLFLASARRPGVTALAGLGDGFPLPRLQGAEALDALEQLRFSGWSPAIACVLGDELADGTYPDYGRWGTPLNSGQGVFRLHPGLEPVPGARVQQFNRSPQLEPAPGEQEADCILVSIPREALGSPEPGDLIYFGAIGVRAGADTNLNRFVAEIDPGFLGEAWSLDQQATNVLLAPLRARIPEDPDPDADGLRTWEELELGTDPVRPDTDGDTLPDGWENAAGLDPLRAVGDEGASGDPDRDGAANAQEYVAGTAPRDGTSVLRILGLSQREGVLQVVATSIPGRRYRLQEAPEIGAAFRDIQHAEPIGPATGSSLSWDVPLSGEPARARFLRVQVLTP